MYNPGFCRLQHYVSTSLCLSDLCGFYLHTSFTMSVEPKACYTSCHAVGRSYYFVWWGMTPAVSPQRPRPPSPPPRNGSPSTPLGPKDGPPFPPRDFRLHQSHRNRILVIYQRMKSGPSGPSLAGPRPCSRRNSRGLGKYLWMLNKVQPSHIVLSCTRGLSNVILMRFA